MNETHLNEGVDNLSEGRYGAHKTENQNSVFNVRVKAGSRRTYFFDVKTNKKEDYFIVVTERRKRFDEEKSFDKNKIFLYKEDFNKFVKGLTETVDYVKTTLMPDFDFTVFDRENRPFDSDENTENSRPYTPSSSNESKDTSTFFEENDKL